MSEQFLSAALDFCATEVARAETRKLFKRCSEYEKPEYSSNYPGNPPCNLEAEDLCDNCQARVAARLIYLDVARRRQLARYRMLRAFRRADGTGKRGV